MVVAVRLGGTDIGKFPLEICIKQSQLLVGGGASWVQYPWVGLVEIFVLKKLHTLLERLETLKSNLKNIFVGKLGGVVYNIDPKKRDDRHLESMWW